MTKRLHNTTEHLCFQETLMFPVIETMEDGVQITESGVYNHTVNQTPCSILR